MFVAIPAGGHLTPHQRQARELSRREWRTAVASADEAQGLVAAQYPEVPFVPLGTYPGAAERTARVHQLPAETGQVDFLMAHHVFSYRRFPQAPPSRGAGRSLRAAWW